VIIETSNSTDDIMDDDALLLKAEEYYREERLLKAAEVLKRVKDQERLFSDRHKMILRWAEIVENSIKKMLDDPEREGSPWIKQKENHGHRDFIVYYEINKGNELIARIDCAIEASLVVPIISVFNESDLYASWMPSFERPIKLGLTFAEKLKEEGRGNQTIHIRTAFAWPFSDRDLFFRVIAVDTIEDDHGCIAIQVLSQTSEDDPIIPKPTRDAVQMEFSNFFMIRACPSNHPCLAGSKNIGGKDHEPLIMLSMSLKVDPKIRVVPQSLQNFGTRTVLGRMWLALLHVAEDVRDGRRPEHKEAIDTKRDLFDWVEDRVGVMIDNLKREESPIAST